jgi:hypothetical protein
VVAYRVEEVPVSSIVLNPKNFRHDEVTAPEECFTALFGSDKDRTYMLNLATDIAANGLDPSSLPIVEPVSSYWRVLEGNRRVACLKAMSNPSLLPLEGMTARQANAYRDKFEHLGTVSSLPRKLLCVITDDTARADHWITLKHTGAGQHKGAGTVEWDATGRARHEIAQNAGAGAGAGGGSGASSEQSGRAVRLLDALRAEFDGDNEITSLLDSAKRRGITTLGRVLIRPENRLRLGLQMDGSDVTFTVSHEALRKAMIKLLSDLGTPNLNSRSINKAADVDDYLDQVEEDLPTAQDRADEPRPPGTGSATPAPKKKRKKEPRTEKKPYRQLVLHHGSTKTRAVLGELKKLTFADNTYTCVILNRVLLDLFTQDVLTALGKTPDYSSAKNLRACVELVDPSRQMHKNRKFPLIHDNLDKHAGPLAIDSMHLYLHRTTTEATHDLPRIQCEYYQPLLEALDDYVEERLTKSDS